MVVIVASIYCTLGHELKGWYMQVSRLIEMQTPLYLEGVRHLHPYFQNQKESFGTLNAKATQFREPSLEII